MGIRCVRLEGSMSMEARDRMISAFTNEPGVTVFLMSLKAGGVALNLTAASHVMLMDPWCAPPRTCHRVSITPQVNVKYPPLMLLDRW